MAKTGTAYPKLNINYACVIIYLSEKNSEDCMRSTTDIIHVGSCCRPAEDRIKLNLPFTLNKYKLLQQLTNRMAFKFNNCFSTCSTCHTMDHSMSFITHN